MAVVELIATQLERIAECKRRIEAEGIVVRDMRGSVMAHPCIAVEAAATKLAADLMAKHKREGMALNYPIAKQKGK